MTAGGGIDIAGIPCKGIPGIKGGIVNGTGAPGGKPEGGIPPIGGGPDI